MRIEGLEIRSISAADTYPLRHLVLWPAKPYHYVQLEDDATGKHFGGFVKNELVAVISLFVEGPEARFREFATHPSFRKQGIGSRLLLHILAVAQEVGAHSL
ncbi:GNAT family N-acetyltransferase [Hymenobacter elongatus]|uniref:GNAT family N-acetyltransferase n=1 Tax=Hymenobacter elongatus TaxID=877208 RepID=A0A4Z0PR61_9BACT|nr:GNAT family N-acetyltransferase [Hymenobacter elongatus]TGE19806.1 GNAT family N-acetyltransferase [Hymenobacter elongatus]